MLASRERSHFNETTKLRLILEGFNIWNRANTGLAPGGGYYSFVNINQYSGFSVTQLPAR